MSALLPFSNTLFSKTTSSITVFSIASSPITLKRATLCFAVQSLLCLPAMAMDSSVVTPVNSMVSVNSAEPDITTPATTVMPATTTTPYIDEQLPIVTVEAIVVIAQRKVESAYGPVAGIAPSRVSTTTGIDESILKSTQTVNAVGQEQIESTGATSVGDALDYTPGVYKSVATDLTTEDFFIRGFRVSGSYRDGQKYQANIFNGRQEVYGLERIEVMKGPGSVLSGTLPPGGVVNAISKRPFFEERYEANAELGSFSRKQVSADINQPLTDTLAVRLVGVYRDSDTFIDYVPNDRQYIAPSLVWQPTEDTRITLQGDYQRDKTKYVPSMPANGTVYNTDNGRIDRDVFPGVVGFDNYDNERATYGYEIEHRFSPDLTVRHYLRKMEATLEFPYSGINTSTDTNATEFTRTVQDRLDESTQVTGGLNVVYNWSLNEAFEDTALGDNGTWVNGTWVENVTLFGIDYAGQEHETERFNSSANVVDLYNRNYVSDEVGSRFNPAVFSSGKNDSSQMGVYLQNQTTINDKWVGVLGVRHDEADLEQTATFIENVQEADYNETTYKVGLAYLMDNGLAPYASYNESFEVELGVDESGNDFEPTTGRQYEAGVRYQPEGRDMLLTASVFNITQSNIVVAGSTPGTKEQLGEVVSKGVELEAQVALNANTNLIAAYSYNDARITKAGLQSPEREGLRQENVPYNTLALWGDYRFADFGLPDLTVGAGIRYRGDTLDRTGDIDVPSHTLVDLTTNYEVDENWALSLNVKNLFDEEYVSCTYDCFYGEPRNIIGKVTYKW